MKRLRVLRRWFTRRIGYARLLCLALLIGFAALRYADPAPVEEIPEAAELTAEEAAALDFLQKDTEADAATEG